MALTREQVMAMDPSPELDALVAQHVMGWHKGESWGGAYWVDSDKCSRYEILVFKPSLHINIAWDVFRRFEMPNIQKLFDQDGNDYYVCEISLNRARGATAPEAICKAALLAVLDL